MCSYLNDICWLWISSSMNINVYFIGPESGAKEFKHIYHITSMSTVKSFVSSGHNIQSSLQNEWKKNRV